MANDVTIRIKAINQTQKTFSQIQKTLQETARVNQQTAARPTQSLQRNIQEVRRYLQEQEKARTAYVKFWEDGLRAQEKAAAAAARTQVNLDAAATRSKRVERIKEFNRLLKNSSIISEDAARQIADDFSDVEDSLRKTITAYQKTANAQQRLADSATRSKLSERTREFNRILKSSTLISEDAARQLANDFSDVEGALTKAVAAYKRGARETQKFRQAQQRLSETTQKFSYSTLRNTQLWNNLTNTFTNSLQIFERLGRSVRTLVGGVVKTTSEFQTMRATLRVTERDVDATTHRLLALNRTVTGIEIDTLLQGFTQLRVAGATVEQAEQNLRAVALATSELGKSTVVTKQVVAQLSQAYAANVPLGSDLRTIFREIPQLSDAATRALGVQIQGWQRFADVVRNTANLDLRTALNRSLAVLGETAIGGDVNTFAVQAEKFEETIADLQRAIGQNLVPALTSGIRRFNEFLGSEKNLARIATGFKDLTSAIVPVGVGIGSFLAITKLINPALRAVVPVFVDLIGSLRGAGPAIARSTQHFEAFQTRLRTARTAAAGFIRAIGPQALLIGGISLAVKIWTDRINENRKAQELIVRTSKMYIASMRTSLEVLRNFTGNTESQKALQTESENISEAIAKIAKELQDLNDTRGINWNSLLNPTSFFRQERELTKQLTTLRSRATLLSKVQKGDIASRSAVLKLEKDLTRELAQQRNVIRAIDTGDSTRTIDEARTERANAVARIKELTGLLRELEDISQKIGDTPIRVDVVTPTPLKLAVVSRQVKELEKDFTLALENVNKVDIQRSRDVLVDRLQVEIGLRRAAARMNIKDTEQLEQTLYNLTADFNERRNKLFEDSDRRLEELRRRVLLPLPDAGGFEQYKNAREETEKFFQTFSARRQIFTVLGKEGQRLFGLLRTGAKETGTQVREGFDSAARSVRAFYNTLRTSNSLLTRIQETVPLVFPEFSKRVGSLIENYSQLNKRQRELLPTLAAYKAEAIATVNAVKQPFQGLVDAFRKSDLFDILRPGIVQEGRQQQAEADMQRRLGLIEFYNTEAERLNREGLQRTQALFNNAFTNIETALSSINLSESVLANIKRIGTAFVASSLRILVQSRIQFEIQKHYDNQLTRLKLANLAKVLAAQNAGESLLRPSGGIGAAISSIAGTIHPLAALVSGIVFQLQVGEGTVRDIGHSIKNQERSRRLPTENPR